MLFDKPKLTEPNEKGFQFGINESLTKYAHEKNVVANLPGVDITVLEVWKDDRRVALLFQNKKGEVIDEVTSGFESAACKLDAYKMLAAQ